MADVSTYSQTANTGYATTSPQSLQPTTNLNANQSNPQNLPSANSINTQSSARAIPLGPASLTAQAPTNNATTPDSHSSILPDIITALVILVILIIGWVIYKKLVKIKDVKTTAKKPLPK